MNHEERRMRINASEVGAIMGIDEYRTPYDVWLEKMGQKPHFEGNKHTQRGHDLEAYGLRLLSEAIGGSCFPNVSNFVHDGKIELSATPDGFICENGEMRVAGMEVKTSLLRVDSVEVIESRKLPWVWQCRMGMLCTGLKQWHLGVVGPRIDEFYHFQIDHDQQLENEMVEYLQWWWDAHVVAGVAPEPTSESDLEKLYPDNYGTLAATPALADKLREYFDLKAAAKDHEAAAERLRFPILHAIGSKSVVIQGNRIIATYKADKNGKKTLRGGY